MATEINLLILYYYEIKLLSQKIEMKFCEMDTINLLNEWYTLRLGLVTLQCHNCRHFDPTYFDIKSNLRSLVAPQLKSRSEQIRDLFKYN